MLFVGIVGDLFISWWKRSHKLKDTSAALGAHGGFLDRYARGTFCCIFCHGLLKLILRASLDSHMAAWLWSVLFGAIFAQHGENFTAMDFDKIMYRLIPITWTVLWSHWFGKRILNTFRAMN